VRAGVVDAGIVAGDVSPRVWVASDWADAVETGAVGPVVTGAGSAAAGAGVELAGTAGGAVVGGELAVGGVGSTAGVGAGAGSGAGGEGSGGAATGLEPRNRIGSTYPSDCDATRTPRCT
jgi:hypothetical protein